MEMRPTPCLKALRERAGLTVELLARRASVPPAIVQRAEKGAPMFPTTINVLAEALHVEPAELLAETPGR
jgi:transcriptional regulator with XRE-family HTH domain